MLVSCSGQLHTTLSSQASAVLGPTTSIASFKFRGGMRQLNRKTRSQPTDTVAIDCRVFATCFWKQFSNHRISWKFIKHFVGYLAYRKSPASQHARFIHQRPRQYCYLHTHWLHARARTRAIRAINAMPDQLGHLPSSKTFVPPQIVVQAIGVIARGSKTTRQRSTPTDEIHDDAVST